MWKIAIDLGSSMTKIYRADEHCGIVLAEPSCVAVVGEEKEVKAIGKEAKNLIGKTAETTSIIYPVYEGQIVDMPLAVEMLDTFLNRINLTGGKRKRAKFLFSLPCGASKKLLHSYYTLAEECGIRKIDFVEQPYLSAVGSGAILSQADPVFCLDIGGGVTNIAVVSANGMIAGLSMNIGGNNIDDTIMQKVAKTNKLRIGILTAERIKNDIGSLAPTPRGVLLAEGSSTETCTPASASIQATEITDCIRVYVDKILEYATAVLRKLPAEVAATVNRNGVFLSGGLMKVPYVAQYIGGILEMRYHVCEEPQFATVIGGGAVVHEKDLLKQFALKSK